VANAAAQFTLMTLNVAHGRKRGPHQALQTKRSIESNLDDVVALLLRHKPDVLALQEADGPSLITGKFDHVQYVADKAEYEHHLRGEHVKGKRLLSGTALLSLLPLHDPNSVTFKRSPPTFSKGFVHATVHWPGDGDVAVDIVSVHLDFLRKSVRQGQLQTLIEHFASRAGPRIVMGDFNCQWTDKDSPLPALADALGLHAYRPEAGGLNTFPKLRRRLDWILISRELEFASYRVLDAVVSDHRAVLCQVRFAVEHL
jgi:endonuclease/exonuclease/phosphatase family metal-dependent hydrolase